MSLHSIRARGDLFLIHSLFIGVSVPLLKEKYATVEQIRILINNKKRYPNPHPLL